MGHTGLSCQVRKGMLQYKLIVFISLPLGMCGWLFHVFIWCVHIMSM